MDRPHAAAVPSLPEARPLRERRVAAWARRAANVGVVAATGRARLVTAAPPVSAAVVARVGRLAVTPCTQHVGLLAMPFPAGSEIRPAAA